jgi:hypothetical protein
MLCIVVIMRIRSTSCLCQGSVEACLCAGLGEQLAVFSPGTISLVGVPFGDEIYQVSGKAQLTKRIHTPL